MACRRGQADQQRYSPEGKLVAAGPPGACVSALCRLRAAVASAGSAIRGCVWLVILFKSPATVFPSACFVLQADKPWRLEAGQLDLLC